MEIFLYNADESEFIKFPVIQKTINVNSPQEIENFKTIGQGDINLTGLLGNRTLEISAFFPLKDYRFNKDNTFKGMEYIDKIESWRSLRKPLYITVSNINISFRCVISKLDYGIKDGSGDIEYSLSIAEFLRNELYVKKTPVKIKTTSSDVVKPLKDSKIKTTDLIKKNIFTGPGLQFPKVTDLSKIKDTIKILSDFRGKITKVQSDIYREKSKITGVIGQFNQEVSGIKGQWVKIKGGFIEKRFLK